MGQSLPSSPHDLLALDRANYPISKQLSFLLTFTFSSSLLIALKLKPIENCGAIYLAISELQRAIKEGDNFAEKDMPKRKENYVLYRMLNCSKRQLNEY
ncbi:hypothetical protein NEOC65_000549 [Neochlamydia sp. AcF65]|nr:hypothetical protein [Neochlamydia sp. AcF65]